MAKFEDFSTADFFAKRGAPLFCKIFTYAYAYAVTN